MKNDSAVTKLMITQQYCNTAISVHYNTENLVNSVAAVDYPITWVGNNNSNTLQCRYNESSESIKNQVNDIEGQS